jgi:hypothetical protein
MKKRKKTQKRATHTMRDLNRHMMALRKAADRESDVIEAALVVIDRVRAQIEAAIRKTRKSGRKR